MTKRFLIALLLMISFAVAASAGSKYVHDASTLPTAALTTIKNNFKAKVSLVKTEKTLGHIDEYEVVLTDGSEITFDAKGNWKEVEVAGNKEVPKGFVLQSIRDYIKKYQPKQKIVGIECERNGYEVTLTNGVDMKFDKDGKFIKYEK